MTTRSGNVFNVWQKAITYKDCGNCGPVFAIYKFYDVQSDTFLYIGKHMTTFDYALNATIDDKLRVQIVMRIKPEKLTLQILGRCNDPVDNLELEF